jgi:predicted AAA+ superfamily ATPase
MEFIRLLVRRDARPDRAGIFYWRTAAGEEVDFVIEAGNKLIPIEVKAASSAMVESALEPGGYVRRSSRHQNRNEFGGSISPTDLMARI